MNITHIMVIGFGALLLLVGALAPQAGWNLPVMILGGLHVVVGNVLVFRQMKQNLQQTKQTPQDKATNE
ncbi:hypothetical protein ACN082_06505 [Rothia sp. CCM 9417]|uniref:hypothetical protein n=1 Tax=unclassified Rothia (in: high G+C Gram-positive bacteria) TaxID=2689056 RepID=UPI003AD1F329